jgi:hypothetical protein
MEGLQDIEREDRRLSRIPLGSMLTKEMVEYPFYPSCQFDHFDWISAEGSEGSSSGYWPETAGLPGKDWASYAAEDDSASSVRPVSADEVASKMYLAKRSARPFKKVTVQGFEYAVEDSGTPGDEEIALTLHELNEFAISVIGFIGRYLDGVNEGRVPVSDITVDIGALSAMYDRLRSRYSVDDVFEAASGSGEEETSYVINLGQEIHMCVRGNGSKDKMIVLYTVMTHELAHVASSTPDHDSEFWSNYAVLRKIVSKMGVVNESDIPLDGGTHCQKVRIDRSEMMGIANVSGFVSSAQREKSGFISTSLPMRMIREEEPESERTYPREAATLSNPFYMQNRSPYVSADQSDASTSEMGGKDVLGDFDWRYGTFERETPVYRTTEPQRTTLDVSGRYSRIPYAMGRLNIVRGELLHTCIGEDEANSHWTR